jgi:hypothetical protein
MSSEAKGHHTIQQKVDYLNYVTECPFPNCQSVVGPGPYQICGFVNFVLIQEHIARGW